MGHPFVEACSERWLAQGHSHYNVCAKRNVTDPCVVDVVNPLATGVLCLSSLLRPQDTKQYGEASSPQVGVGVGIVMERNVGIFVGRLPKQTKTLPGSGTRLAYAAGRNTYSVGQRLGAISNPVLGRV